mgnify:CR=1 FL=1
MEIKEMTMEDIEARESAIREELTNPEADLDALEAEQTELRARKDEIRKEAEQLQPEAVECFRYLHRHPETAHHEIETNRFIRQELDKLGIPYEAPQDNVTIAVVDSGLPGPVVGLRCDTDALAAGLINGDYDVIFTWDSTSLRQEENLQLRVVEQVPLRVQGLLPEQEPSLLLLRLPISHAPFL